MIFLFCIAWWRGGSYRWLIFSMVNVSQLCLARAGCVQVSLVGRQHLPANSVGVSVHVFRVDVSCAVYQSACLRAHLCCRTHCSHQSVHRHTHRLSSAQASSRTGGARSYDMSLPIAVCGIRRSTWHQFGNGKWRTFSNAVLTSEKIDTQFGKALYSSRKHSWRYVLLLPQKSTRTQSVTYSHHRLQSMSHTSKTVRNCC